MTEEFDIIDHVNPVINVEIGAWTNEAGVTYAQAKGDKGDQGIPGQSAYDIWLELGNTGTKADFIASLKGEKGDVIHCEMVWAYPDGE